MTSTNKSIFDKLTKYLEETNLPVDFDKQGNALSVSLGNDQGRHLVLMVTRINDGSRLTLFTGFPFVPNNETGLALTTLVHICAIQKLSPLCIALRIAKDSK